MLCKGIDWSYKAWIFHAEILPHRRYDPIKEDAMDGGPICNCDFDSHYLPQMIEDMQDDFMYNLDV